MPTIRYLANVAKQGCTFLPSTIFTWKENYQKENQLSIINYQLLSINYQSIIKHTLHYKKKQNKKKKKKKKKKNF